jgi:hypothetical protein
LGGGVWGGGEGNPPTPVFVSLAIIL